MRRSLVLAGFLLLTAGTALAQQDYPTIETAPAFMYIRTASPFQGANDFNCVGGGGTFAYNFSKYLGMAADLGGCKVLNQNDTIIGSQLNGNEFTYLFGPRVTLRNNSKFQPFFEVNFGGTRISVSCKNSAENCVNASGGNTYTKNAFAMTAGGGFDFKLSNKFAIRLVQAEYLYTRFGNNCGFNFCNSNNSQNSFRLKSGIVISWGGNSSKQP